MRLRLDLQGFAQDDVGWDTCLIQRIFSRSLRYRRLYPRLDFPHNVGVEFLFEVVVDIETAHNPVGFDRLQYQHTQAVCALCRRKTRQKVGDGRRIDRVVHPLESAVVEHPMVASGLFVERKRGVFAAVKTVPRAVYDEVGLDGRVRYVRSEFVRKRFRPRYRTVTELYVEAEFFQVGD